MYSGVSGLKVHQTKLDVIGNNIANVNTVAYKSSNITFQEILSQTLATAQPPTTTGTGGTNPSQVGLGTTIGAITTNHNNGNIQTTDSNTDLAIDGDGFFVVSDGFTSSYTRAGNFTIDSAGNLVTVNGEKVMGWNVDANNEIDTSAPLEAIDLSSLNMPATATENLMIQGNLNSSTPVGNTFEYNMSVFDSLGTAHTITMTFERVGDPEDRRFSFAVEGSDDMTIAAGGSRYLTFDVNGKLDQVNGDELSISFNNGADEMEASITFNPNRMTMYDNPTSITGNQDGYSAGSLINLGIDKEGNVIGNFSNGRDNHVASLAIATFINPQGLEKIGGNLFTTTWNSGEPEVGIAGTGMRGAVASNSLEMSNVDLSREFTEMIVAQRGFQANSKIITTSDEVLQELVNLKR
jgi:flagellar hook protein FlgE